jgi:hypothetical protein
MASRQESSDVGDLRERSLPELLKQLSQEVTQLLKQEIELAKAEVGEKGRQAGKGAGLLGSAGVIGLGAVGALTACFILALNAVMPAWLAALIVAVVYGVVAAILAMQGRNRIRQATPPVPEQTVETLKEDVQWAKNQTPSVKR